jgi:excisionase family DNA binding protein
MPLPSNVKPICVSIDQAADALGVVPLTISRMIKAGELPAYHVRRRVVIKLADLEAYLADNEVMRS